MGRSEISEKIALFHLRVKLYYDVLEIFIIFEARCFFNRHCETYAEITEYVVAISSTRRLYNEGNCHITLPYRSFQSNTEN